MKRSEINAILKDSDDFVRKMNFHLPPYAYWLPDDWRQKGLEASEIVEHKLGWDITDFGQGNFPTFGLVLFTIRNGRPENWQTKQGKLYAEKILIIGEGQVTPMHFHWAKMEDIINRGGGELVIELYNSTPEEGLDTSSDVEVSTDGVVRRVPAGGQVRLSPGESITLVQGCYHKFWAENGRVLAGEVSLVNDDDKDNRFYRTLPRFPEIEEDEPPLYLLCTEYSKYWMK